MNSPEIGGSHEHSDSNEQLFSRAIELGMVYGVLQDESDSSVLNDTIHTFVIDKRLPEIEELLRGSEVTSLQIWQGTENKVDGEPPSDARVDFTFASDLPGMVKKVTIGHDYQAHQVYDEVLYDDVNTTLPESGYSRAKLDLIWRNVVDALESGDYAPKTQKELEAKATEKLRFMAMEDLSMTPEDRQRIDAFIGQLENWFKD